MCISREELDIRVMGIREYKSLKKDAEANLKSLEADVKNYMYETNQTKLIGYGFTISYKEQEKETVVKEKVLELLDNPIIKEVIKREQIDISKLFNKTSYPVLRIS